MTSTHPERELAAVYTAPAGVWSARRLARWLLAQRLFQFASIGAVLFALAPASESPYSIAIDSSRFEPSLRREAARMGVAALAPDQRAAVLSRVVEDDVLVAEARRLGLDKDDAIVRQRLVQKMLFLAEDLGGASRPATEADYREFYLAHTELYRLPLRIELIHVFAKDPLRLQELSPQVVAYEAAHPLEPPPFGDPFPQGRRLSLRVADLAPSWGEEFRDALVDLEVGVWSQPIPSRYGAHLVKVIVRSSEGVAPYEEARSRVPLDLLRARREEAVSKLIATLMKDYRVSVDGKPFDVHRPTTRMAAHNSSVDDE